MKVNKKAIILTSVILGAGLGVATYFFIKNNMPVKLDDAQVRNMLISSILIDKKLPDTAQNRAAYQNKTIDELKDILAQ